VKTEVKEPLLIRPPWKNSYRLADILF